MLNPNERMVTGLADGGEDLRGQEDYGQVLENLLNLSITAGTVPVSLLSFMAPFLEKGLPCEKQSKTFVD